MRSYGFSRLYGHRVAVAPDAGYGLRDPDYRSKTAMWAVSRNVEVSDSVWELTRQDLREVESLSSLIIADDDLVVGGGGRDGISGEVFVINRSSANICQTIHLPARVIECGLAVAHKRLCVACEDGSIVCLGTKP